MLIVCHLIIPQPGLTLLPNASGRGRPAKSADRPHTMIVRHRQLVLSNCSSLECSMYRSFQHRTHKKLGTNQSK